MKHSTRMAVLLLAALALVSCSGGDPIVENRDGETVTNETIETPSAETEITVELPDKNYGDAEVMFLTSKNTADQYTCYEIYADEMNGTLINDAVFVRNGLVEQSLGIRIAETKLENVETVAKKSLTAGDTAYDVVMPYMNKAISLATEGFLNCL